MQFNKAKISKFGRLMTSWIIILTMIFSTGALAFASANIRMTTNGAAGNYAPGAVLVLYGRVEDVKGEIVEPVPKTQVTITVKKDDGYPIFSAQVNTDSDGYFRTNFNLPKTGLGDTFNIEAAALGITEKLIAPVTEARNEDMFLGCTLPFSYSKDVAKTIDPKTGELALVFIGNVNYFNNKNGGDLQNIGINSKNLDCVHFYEVATNKEIATSIRLLKGENDNDSAKTAYYDSSGNVISADNAANKASKRNQLDLSIQDELKTDTLYRLELSGELSKNNSASLGEDKILYFKTTSDKVPGEGEGEGDSGDSGSGGSSGGSGGVTEKPPANNTVVESKPVISGDKATVNPSDDEIDSAVKNIKPGQENSMTIKITAADLEKNGNVTELSLQLSKKQVEKLSVSLDKVVYDTPFGALQLPVSVLKQGTGDIKLSILKDKDIKDSFQVELSDDKGDITKLNGRVSLSFPIVESDNNIIKHNGTIMKNGIIKNKEMKAVTKGFSTFAAGSNYVTFGDVSNHWAKSNIESLASKNIVNGTGENNFSPNNSVTRAEFVKMLTGSLDELSVAGAKSMGFSDVSGDVWYADAVNWAAANQVASGTGNSKFSPNQQISRQDMAVIFDRFAKTMKISLYKENSKDDFADDAQISEYAKESVYNMQQASMMSGVGNNNFNPKGYATRAEVAKMIDGLIDKMVANT